MIPLIQQHRDAINSLCQRFGVVKLEVFGSAAEADKDDIPHDLDFLVTFARKQGMGPADQYFGLLGELQSLFERPIDLVCTTAVRNPYFLQEVNRSRSPLYAA